MYLYIRYQRRTARIGLQITWKCLIVVSISEFLISEIPIFSVSYTRQIPYTFTSLVWFSSSRQIPHMPSSTVWIPAFSYNAILSGLFFPLGIIAVFSESYGPKGRITYYISRIVHILARFARFHNRQKYSAIHGNELYHSLVINT